MDTCSIDAKKESDGAARDSEQRTLETRIDAAFSHVDLKEDDFAGQVRRSVNEFHALLDARDTLETDQLSVLRGMAAMAHNRGVAYVVTAVTCVLAALWTNHFAVSTAVEATVSDFMSSLKIACEAEEIFRSKYRKSIESVSIIRCALGLDSLTSRPVAAQESRWCTPRARRVSRAMEGASARTRGPLLTGGLSTSSLHLQHLPLCDTEEEANTYRY